MSVSENSILGRIVRVGGVASLSWLAALPFLGAAVACFWAVEVADGAPPVVFVVGFLVLLAAVLIAPGIACLMGAGRHTDARHVAISALRALGIGFVSIVLASLMSLVGALKPEAVPMFDAAYVTGQMIAVAVPAVVALIFGELFVHTFEHKGYRIGGYVSIPLIAAAGAATWWWSAGLGFGAVSGSNADDILLLMPTILLAGLVITCTLHGLMCGGRPKRQPE